MAALVEFDGIARRLLIWPPDLPLEHLPYVAKEAELDLVLSDRPDLLRSASLLPVLECRPSAVEGDKGTAHRLTTEWIMFTSGTSGRPKLVVHTLASLCGAIDPSPQRQIWGTFYDIRRYGGMQIFLRAALGGGSLILAPVDNSIGDYLALLARQGVTHISGTPSHWRKVLMDPSGGLISPKYVRLSGEIVDQAILDALAKFYPAARLVHAFASTEAGVAFEVTDSLAGFPTSFLADMDEDVDLNILGQTLRVRSPRTALRYLGDYPDLRDQCDFVDTSDIISVGSDRCSFLGRASGVINIGGLKVHPEEIESILNGHPRVRFSLVKGRQNPLTGEIVVADVVLDDDRVNTTLPDEGTIEQDLLSYCKSKLPPHKRPVSIRFVGSLPMSPGGKLIRNG